MNPLAILVASSLVCLTNASPIKTVDVGTHEQKPKEISKVQTATDSDKPGTEAFPLFVKVVPPVDTQNGATDKKTDEEKTSYDKITAYSTFALAVITAALALFTYRLWSITRTLVKDAEVAAKSQAEDFRKSLQIAKESADSTKAMVDTMKDTAKKELRAYVGIVGHAMKRNGVEIKFVNGGATPAHNVAVYADLLVGQEIDLNEIQKRMITIRSDKTVSGITLWKGSEQSMLVEANFDRGVETIPIFVFGNIVYMDSFGDEQNVWFQYKVEWRGGAIPWNFIPCQGTNKAT